jgi:hypothetical protein
MDRALEAHKTIETRQFQREAPTSEMTQLLIAVCKLCHTEHERTHRSRLSS